ncbi:MAG: phage gp6-like head-tail connector protein [Clostridia bacterium]|nr:phage gp6-like head-tail connector protein [Clostridia bacterium]
MCKNYGYGTDADWQPEVAQMCMDAAKEYLANAGVKERQDSPLYDLAVYMLTMHWYDNRGIQIVGQIRGELLLGIRSIIHQLSE